MATWTKSDPRWAALNPYQRAALMALMEADGANPQSARNALGAMINRSTKEGVNLGDHVGQAIYQPTIEPSQQARLDRLMRSEAFPQLTSWAERRSQGLEPDPVQGATHFLAPEKTMLALEAQNPAKYKNWGPRGANWTGFDPSTGSYKGVVMRDGSHAFLAPGGAAPPVQPQQTSNFDPATGQLGPKPLAMVTDAGREPPPLPASAQPSTDQIAGMGALNDATGSGWAAFGSAVGKKLDGLAPPAPAVDLQLATAQAPRVDLNSIMKILERRRRGIT